MKFHMECSNTYFLLRSGTSRSLLAWSQLKASIPFENLCCTKLNACNYAPNLIWCENWVIQLKLNNRIF